MTVIANHINVSNTTSSREMCMMLGMLLGVAVSGRRV